MCVSYVKNSRQPVLREYSRSFFHCVDHNECMFYVYLQDASLEVSRLLFVKPHPSNSLTHCCHGLSSASDPSAVRVLTGRYFIHSFIIILIKNRQNTVE